MKKLLKALSISSLFFISCESNENDWVSLFDGESLEGWEMKIKGYELNNNYRNTFSVKDESIRVSYDNYDSFGEKFGHLFYTKQKFKNYHLKLDYRFYGEHANKFKNEDEAWNYKNSGVMLHSEHPKQMFLNQGFPVHCISSSSDTYHNDDWISVEFLVFSDSIVHQIIKRDTVISYSNIRLGGTYLSDNFTDKIDQPLKEGYISLQSEGHPIEFRNIKIKEFD